MGEKNILDSKKLILATRPFTKENRVKSWIYTLSTLLFLSALQAGAILFETLLFRIICSILCGLMIVRMFVIYHDHQHKAILSGSAFANLIMTLFGIYVLAPRSIWKRSHDHHHNHNSKLFSASIGSFPIVSKQRFLSMSRKEQRHYLMVRHPITILLGYFSMFIGWMCISSFLSNPRKHIDSLIAIVIHITASVFIIIYMGWGTWLLGIFIPFSIACGIGTYLFYAQHNFPGVWFAEKTGWKYEVAALESSSYMIMSPVMAWFTANIGYHHIHHINSRIPFYRLPEVMKHFPELQKPKITSLKLKDVIACFRLKVWDPEQNKMVGLDRLYKIRIQ